MNADDLFGRSAVLQFLRPFNLQGSCCSPFWALSEPSVLIKPAGKWEGVDK